MQHLSSSQMVDPADHYFFLSTLNPKQINPRTHMHYSIDTPRFMSPKLSMHCIVEDTIDQFDTKFSKMLGLQRRKKHVADMLISTTKACNCFKLGICSWTTSSSCFPINCMPWLCQREETWWDFEWRESEFDDEQADTRSYEEEIQGETTRNKTQHMPNQNIKEGGVDGIFCDMRRTIRRSLVPYEE